MAESRLQMQMLVMNKSQYRRAQIKDPDKPAHMSDPDPHGNHAIWGWMSDRNVHGRAPKRPDVRYFVHTWMARLQRRPIHDAHANALWTPAGSR